MLVKKKQKIIRNIQIYIKIKKQRRELNVFKFDCDNNNKLKDILFNKYNSLNDIQNKIRIIDINQEDVLVNKINSKNNKRIFKNKNYPNDVENKNYLYFIKLNIIYQIQNV